MRKKLDNFVMLSVLFVVFSIAITPLVSAEDSTNVESQDVVLKAFTDNFGSRVRLLQLYKSLDTQIIKGEEAIKAINQVMPDYDSSELELVLENMKAVADQINETLLKIPEGVDSEILQNLTSDFLVLLNESKSLIRQFHDILHEDFTDEEFAQIRVQVNENAKLRVQNRINAVKERIRQYIRAHNENIVKKMLNRSDIRFNESALANKQQLKNELRQHIRTVIGNQTQQIRQLKERVRKMRRAQEQQIRQLSVNVATRARERLSVIHGKISEKLNARLDKNEHLMGKLAKLSMNKTNIDWKGRMVSNPKPQDVLNLVQGRR